VLGQGVERLAATGERLVEQVVAVEVQDVEEERVELVALVPFAGAEARAGDLEGLGPAVVAQRDRLAVEHDRPGGERAGRRDDLGQARGDLVERAREDRDVVAVAVHLHAGAVHLPLDRRGRRLLHRRRDVRRRAGEHRRDRAADLEPQRGEPAGAVGERDPRDLGEVAVHRERPPHVGGRHPGRPGDRRRS
jgi:hypothetical protein